MADGSRLRSSVGRRGTGSGTDDSSSPIFELLVLFVLVFAVQQVAALLSIGLMAGLFVLAPPLTSNPWTIVTSVYAHGGVGHLVSNSLALIVFGWPVARATTRLRFHLFFLVTGAIAGVSQIVLTNAAALVLPVPGTGGVLGASGAVFALLGYLIASNRLSAGLASFVDVPGWLAALVFLGLAIAVTMATAAPGVALIAHFAGFLVGLVAGRARVLNAGSRSSRRRSTV
ncbi:rhomboid family intramembrane serine protease [Haloterrigena alkaliphila]|uniref:Rhomboid family intramembrane serine protease n=1 Tax=Haloterrigena alkaliphila TaxID=2816475 RepID=A0A8A2VGZ1_9EURY|nr:rhomboid family intramembrane serine protease [Haloterrigena alkaliphila]QSW99960.1 rhomboid family intramembrane serine protease [Haloterrigena alkaliphila]